MDRVEELEQAKRFNPWQKWIHFAHAVDAWRIFPRLFFSAYIFFFLYSGMWFMALATPTPAQAGLISVVIGAGAAWFGLYVRTGDRA